MVQRVGHLGPRPQYHEDGVQLLPPEDVPEFRGEIAPVPQEGLEEVVERVRSHLEILPSHEHIMEGEENREPEALLHRRARLLGWRFQAQLGLVGTFLRQRALGRLEHGGDDGLERLHGLEALLLEPHVLGELREADDQIGEGALRDHDAKPRFVDLRDVLVREVDDALVRLAGRHGKDTKHGPPAGPNVLAPGLDHLDEAPQDHVLDAHIVRVRHDVLERLEEVLLELETSQFLNLHEAHRQLPEGVERKEHDGSVGVASNPVEVLSEHIPDVAPFEPDTGHVVVADLDDLLETVCAWGVVGPGHPNLVPADFG